MINNKKIQLLNLNCLIFILALWVLPGCSLMFKDTLVQNESAATTATAQSATASTTSRQTATTSDKQNANEQVADRGDDDGDGIINSQDQCLDTAKNAPVDINGCDLDTDGDKVADYKDACRGTPKGVQVDERGCGLDDDHDGIANYRDRCANTPADVGVDGYGCEWDSDGDGVADSRDQCAGTPPGLAVEPMGCILVQVVTLEGVNFQTGSHMLNDGARSVLDSVAETLKRHPKLRVEIGGHTDDTGPVAINEELSLERAQEAYQYLVQHGVNRETMTVKGYSSAQPKSNNESDEGRKENRRVEMRIVEVD